MDNLLPVIFLLLGALIGALVVWLVLKASAKRSFEDGRANSVTEVATLNERLAAKDRELQKLHEAFERESAGRTRAATETTTLKAQLAAEQRGAQQRDESFRQASAELGEKFKALSRDALKDNN